MNSTLSNTLILGVLLAAPGVGQNLLTNGSFDCGGLSGWTQFGNAFLQSSNTPQFVPRSDPNLVSMFGNFSGGFDVSGIFQAFPAGQGQTFTLDCWSRHYSGDALTGNGPPNDNWMVMKIAFFDAGHNEIGSAEQTILDGTSPTDIWIYNTPVSGTAPAGTASVEALILFLQPASAGGAGHVDDVRFISGMPPQNAAYPGSGEDLVLSTGIGGAPPSAGPGDDVKTPCGGQLLEVNVSSPQTTFDLMQYWVLAQAFPTGMPPTPPLPGVHFDFANPIVILVGSLSPPFGGPIVLPGVGSSTVFAMPPGLAGTSVMLQGVVFTSMAGNGAFAISDGHEIRLQ